MNTKMSYRFEFDETPVGDFRLPRNHYEILQDGLRTLCSELDAWNLRALEHGAASEPYEAEVALLSGMIEWGDEKLKKAEASVITVNRISIGSLRYAKAALILVVRKREDNRREKAREGWPEAALRSLDDGIQRVISIAQNIDHEPSDVLWEVIPQEIKKQELGEMQTAEWDVFISHASEDKEAFVRPLAEELEARGLKVWFDEFTLTIGDSLRQSIDRGLARSRFGIVVISPNFMRKEWPQRELDGLVAREIAGVKVILPIWHCINAEGIRKFSPTLADKLAVSSEEGIDHVIAELMRAIGRGNDGPRSGYPTGREEPLSTPDVHATTGHGIIHPATVVPSFRKYPDSIPHNWQDDKIGRRSGTPPTDPHHWVKMVYGPHISLKLRIQGGSERLSEVETMNRVRQYLLPLGYSKVDPSNFTPDFARSGDGPVVFLTNNAHPDIAVSATQYYSWGELVAVDFRLLQQWNERPEIGLKFIPIGAVEKVLVDGLSNAMEFARDGLSASFPISVQVGLIDVSDYGLGKKSCEFGGNEVIGQILSKQLGYSFDITSFSDDPHVLLLPFFERIYDAAGEVRPN